MLSTTHSSFLSMARKDLFFGIAKIVVLQAQPTTGFWSKQKISLKMKLKLWEFWSLDTNLITTGLESAKFNESLLADWLDFAQWRPNDYTKFMLKSDRSARTNPQPKAFLHDRRKLANRCGETTSIHNLEVSLKWAWLTAPAFTWTHNS